MPHKQRSPQYTHSFIDSCAFNPGGLEEAASRRIMDKNSNIIVAHSVQKEVEHPNTPEDIKRLAKAFIYTIESDLIPDEMATRSEIRTLMQGNANPGRHQEDADHLFELYKYGGGYFITTDNRILGLSEQLFDNYFITALKPSEYEAFL